GAEPAAVRGPHREPGRRGGSACDHAVVGPAPRRQDGAGRDRRSAGSGVQLTGPGGRLDETWHRQVKRPRRWRRRRLIIRQRTRLRPRDAISEAIAATVARPVRAMLTITGTVLGGAWFVTALGLASTADGQVVVAFAGRLATQVTVRQLHPGPAPAAYPYPPDVEHRLEALNGVVAAGVYWRVRPARLAVSSGEPRSPRV